jgi:integrase
VFHTGTGGQLTQRGLRRSWHAIRDSLGFPSVRYHDLRHTCATWLAAQTGCTAATVQRILGHRKAETTELYLHTLDDLRGVMPHALDKEHTR